MKNILDFLSELKENNDRTWFNEHKNEYESARKEFEQICYSLILKIGVFDEDIKHVDVKDCVFRIYRDIRFSNDKTPYKTHFGAFIASAGGRKSNRGGYYLHLDPAGSFLSVGVWCPPPAVLKAIRQSIYYNIEEFNEIRSDKDFIRLFKNSFYEEDKLKTVPQGFSKDFKDAELLKLKHFLVSYDLDQNMLFSNDFVYEIASIAEKSYPFIRFLNYTVDEVV
ncbi:MAG TPA: DUF2461 domain-containing protein [Paludibacteraceae bacterium]|nr:DUF2461 domain-containing protein [Paludibacteraceae bacterium]